MLPPFPDPFQHNKRCETVPAGHGVHLPQVVAEHVDEAEVQVVRGPGPLVGWPRLQEHGLCHLPQPDKGRVQVREWCGEGDQRDHAEPDHECGSELHGAVALMDFWLALQNSQRKLQVQAARLLG